MKLVKRENNEIISGETIATIAGLENSQLVMLERGDAMKKAAKNARGVFGRKDVFSVKGLNEAIKANAAKAAKKADSSDGFALCCVCTDFFPIHTLDERGICRHCQL